MPYPPSVQGDVIEVRIRGLQGSVNTINVFHYMLDQVGSSTMPLDQLFNSLDEKLAAAGGFEERMYGCISFDWVHFQTEYQRVSPVRSPYFIKQKTANVGTVNLQALAPFSTIEIVKQTNAAGKGFSGRCYLPACPKDWALRDVIQGIANPPLTAFGQAIMDNLTIPPGTTIAVPIVWSHRRPNDRHTMLKTYFNPFLRSLHRRVHGKGI